MVEITTTVKTQRFFLLLVLCASPFLFLANLGNHYLWQDEAQTALISRTILTRGVPVGYDGKNCFSQELGAEYGKNYLRKWHTCLPFASFSWYPETPRLCPLPLTTARGHSGCGRLFTWHALETRIPCSLCDYS